jgi:hypothetical protein
MGMFLMEMVEPVSRKFWRCMYLSTEWISLHHVDEASLELKLMVDLKCWSSVNVLDAWSRELSQCLLRHGFRNLV